MSEGDKKKPSIAPPPIQNMGLIAAALAIAALFPSLITELEGTDRFVAGLVSFIVLYTAALIWYRFSQKRGK